MLMIWQALFQADTPAAVQCAYEKQCCLMGLSSYVITGEGCPHKYGATYFTKCFIFVAGQRFFLVLFVGHHKSVCAN